MDETFWRRQWKQGGNWARVWCGVADDLLVAADVLAAMRRSVTPENIRLGKAVPKELQIGRALWLLRASAIEVLLKARAARNGHKFVNDDGGFRDVVKKPHDLVAIAEATRFRLNDEERDLLSRLTPAIVLGRYPIGKKWDLGLKKHPQPGVGYVIATYHSSADDPVLARLIVRLRRSARRPERRSVATLA
jgi:hypothetical protein